jgi:hypothetical protein
LEATPVTGDQSDQGDPEDTRSKADADLEREVREGRKFTIAEAIGRMAGPGALKGASPASNERQAEAQIKTWLEEHVQDSQGSLQVVLLREACQSRALLNNLERPLAALREYCRQVLDSHERLTDLVRSCDMEWGREYGERPRFDTGGTPDKDDPYTLESVRSALACAVEQLGPCGGWGWACENSGAIAQG